MTKNEALKMALEALEAHADIGIKADKAITAIREALAQPETVSPGGGLVPAVPVAVYGYCPVCGGAGVMRERRPNGDDKCTNGHKYPSSKALAQPEQEPVACVGTNGELMWLNKPKVIYSKPIPLYTTPPHRKPLTEKEIDQITEQLDETTIGWSTHEFARAIEAAHGIKVEA